MAKVRYEHGQCFRASGNGWDLLTNEERPPPLGHSCFRTQMGNVPTGPQRITEVELLLSGLFIFYDIDNVDDFNNSLSMMPWIQFCL